MYESMKKNIGLMFLNLCYAIFHTNLHLHKRSKSYDIEDKVTLNGRCMN